jgi:hypothetical protein
MRPSGGDKKGAQWQHDTHDYALSSVKCGTFRRCQNAKPPPALSSRSLVVPGSCEDENPNVDYSFEWGSVRGARAAASCSISSVWIA